MTDIFHYFNFLPDDIIKEHIFPKLSPVILVWLTKENYIKYHYVIKDIIQKNRLESYIRDIIRNDYSFVFNYLLDEQFNKWLNMKKYTYKCYIFENYIRFLMQFCIDNNSNKCLMLIQNKGSNNFKEKWSKKVKIKDCRWSN
tara:strand:- start:94 stop:519 length:426 start_codon:yes stop_codon:yes gene_type:complete